MQHENNETPVPGNDNAETPNQVPVDDEGTNVDGEVADDGAEVNSDTSDDDDADED